MYQDFTSRRPMEVETYLGAPVQLAKAANLSIPRIETLYTLLRHVNATNKDRPAPAAAPVQTNGAPPPQAVHPPPRTASMQPPPRQMNGAMAGPRPRGGMGGSMGPSRRGPPPVNGYRGPPNGMQRRPSFDDNNLDEFSHVVLYDDLPDGDFADGGPPGLSVKERELMLRERELQLRQQEMHMRSRGGRRPSHNRHHHDFDEDDEDDDFVDPMVLRHPQPPMDDNFDMMSVTSRRTTKRNPSQGQMRKDMYAGGPPMRGGGYGPRSYMNRNRTSAQLVGDMPMAGGNILDNAMMGFSSNRYGNVDRKEMHNESRTNSLTAARLNEMGQNGGPYPGPPSRRTSRSPGNPFGGAMARPHGRPSPPHDQYGQNGPPRNGRPSPPGGMPAPVPRYPPGQGNAVHPQAVEQQVGVSKPYPPKAPPKSLTGSASASAGSGDSGSAKFESDPSAHSSQSSFAPRTMIGAVR